MFLNKCWLKKSFISKYVMYVFKRKLISYVTICLTEDMSNAYRVGLGECLIQATNRTCENVPRQKTLRTGSGKEVSLETFP